MTRTLDSDTCISQITEILATSDFTIKNAPLAKLFARSASCDVTPRGRPVRLAGYAARKDPVATILDPIEISAVLLECGKQRCLILSFDLLTVGTELQDAILSRLQSLGLAADEIVLFASHTHNAPATDLACAAIGIPDSVFVNELAEATETLVRRIQGQQPCETRLEILQGKLNHSINRRRYWPYPTIGRMHGFQLTSVTFSPNPSGPRDERATVMLLRKADDGQALGLLWHYTCHPTAVVPGNVISSDYPGAVRLALREQFGEIPCLFVQGFCGNIRPNIKASPQKTSLSERFQKLIRIVAFGNLFPSLSAEDWTNWSTSVAAAVANIARSRPTRTLSPTGLRTGAAQIPLHNFFTGSTPDRMLAAKVVRIGDDLEIVALSAEPSVEWQQHFDRLAPPPPARIRLYAGYLGALFGYLPTAAQVPEGGYEVEGFQPFFGLSGHFEADRIEPAVTGCVKAAFEMLERGEC